MDTIPTNRLRELIARETGLVVPQHDEPQLAKLLTERVKALKLGSPYHYLSLLGESVGLGAEEWRLLVARLTTGESYFFRDSGQFRLLEERILPELLARHAPDKTLRLWSAGCATGEEPYSLAILLERLVPELSSWQIHLLGSDINEHALEVAREGRYGEWSFRHLATETIDRYFHRRRRHGGGAEVEWQLDRRFRKMVQFLPLNLNKEGYPDPELGLARMDLIICRNVFIYFDPETVQRIIERLAASLAPDGYLMIGHAEWSAARRPPGLISQVFPESLVYRKMEPVRPVPALLARGSEPVVGRARERMLTAARRMQSVALPPRGGVVAPPKGSEVPPKGSGGPVGRGAVSPKGGVVVPGGEMVERLERARERYQRGAYREVLELVSGLACSVEGDAPKRGAPGGDGLRPRFDACFLVARAAANLGEAALADQACRQAMRILPLAPSPYLLLAHLLQEKGEERSALECLKKAIYLDSAYVPAYLEMGALHARLGEEAKAARMRRSAAELLRRLPPGDRLETFEEWTVADLLRHLEGGEEASPAPAS